MYTGLRGRFKILGQSRALPGQAQCSYRKELEPTRKRCKWHMAHTAFARAVSSYCCCFPFWVRALSYTQLLKRTSEVMLAMAIWYNLWSHYVALWVRYRCFLVMATSTTWNVWRLRLQPSENSAMAFGERQAMTSEGLFSSQSQLRILSEWFFNCSLMILGFFSIFVISVHFLKFFLDFSPRLCRLCELAQCLGCGESQLLLPT